MMSKPTTDNGQLNLPQKPKQTFRRIIKRFWVISAFSIAIAVGAGAGLFYLWTKTHVSGLTIEQMEQHPIMIDIPLHFEITLEMNPKFQKFENMTITSYCNRKEETDKTPNITASNIFVGEGYCAFSQDLWKKAIKPGDLVYILKLKRWYVAQDAMNLRWTNRADIFVYKRRLKDGTYPKELTRSFKSTVYVVSIE